LFDNKFLLSRGLVFNGRHLPYNPDLVLRAKELRKNMTKAEKVVWFRFLESVPYRFVAQKTIDNYIVDFYCSSLKLIVEIDGEQHYTNEGKQYDSERDSILEKYGLKICRIKNSEVFDNFDYVCERIRGYFIDPPAPLLGGNTVTEISD
jgi:very-short-patch-repair endonuclease